MLGHIWRRILVSVPLIVLVLVATFALLQAIPGDPARIVLGKLATEEQVTAKRSELGLDRPLHEQFVAYAGRTVQGDFGRSYKSNTPVREELAARLPATIELAVTALVIALVVGVSLGVLASLRPRGVVDALCLLVALGGVSLPIFWLGLIVIEAMQPGGWVSGLLPMFEGLPTGGRYSPAWAELPKFVAETPGATGFYLWDTLVVAGEPEAFGDVLVHLALPALVLSTVPMALIARITRASVGEELLKDYIRTARAKGLATGGVVVRHALRNAAIPIVTTTGTQLGYLLGGAVLTETIFSWPGLGTYVVGAIQNGDRNQLAASILVVAVGFIVINLVVDLSYAFLDPRVRRSSSSGREG